MTAWRSRPSLGRALRHKAPALSGQAKGRQRSGCCRWPTAVVPTLHAVARLCARPLPASRDLSGCYRPVVEIDRPLLRRRTTSAFPKGHFKFNSRAFLLLTWRQAHLDFLPDSQQAPTASYREAQELARYREPVEALSSANSNTGVNSSQSKSPCSTASNLMQYCL